MSTVTIQETFKVNDILTDVTSVVLSDPTGTYGVKRDDTDETVVADSTAFTNTSTGVYSYEFTEPVGVSSITYTYWVEWVYEGETYRNEKTVLGATPALASTRSTSKYVDWIKAEFQPLTLATPDATIEQCLENAIRYWNTHSAYKISAMVDYSLGQKRALIPGDFKTVVSAYPGKSASWIWNDHPLWTLTGVAVLDNVTSDLILMSEAFRNYQTYVGTDFRWQFIKSEDPNVTGGYLYCVNLPHGNDSLFVVGTKRVTSTEDIKQEYILDWILSYTKNLVKICEGNTLRKAGIVNIKNDGQELVTEGFAEKEKLQERLARDGRWCVLARRC